MSSSKLVRRSAWVAVHERDELGSDLVPDYMSAVRDGQGAVLLADDVGNTIWRVTGPTSGS